LSDPLSDVLSGGDGSAPITAVPITKVAGQATASDRRRAEEGS